jgi:hypothetical protein
VLFKIYQSVNAIFFREASHGLGAVFVDALYQITRHANIKRAAQFAGEDVDTV